jgi:hypothetical protein
MNGIFRINVKNCIGSDILFEKINFLQKFPKRNYYDHLFQYQTKNDKIPAYDYRTGKGGVPYTGNVVSTSYEHKIVAS